MMLQLLFKYQAKPFLWNNVFFHCRNQVQCSELGPVGGWNLEQFLESGAVTD